MKWTFGIMMVSLIFGCSPQHPKTVPAFGSKQWMEQVDRLVGTADAAGHGPDVGSEEWMHTVSRKLQINDPQGHGPDPGSDEWKRAVHRKLFHTEAKPSAFASGGRCDQRRAIPDFWPTARRSGRRSEEPARPGELAILTVPGRRGHSDRTPLRAPVAAPPGLRASDEELHRQRRDRALV
jgi:hypothetical protein